MNVQYTVSKPILKEVNLQKTKLASYDNYQQKIVKYFKFNHKKTSQY